MYKINDNILTTDFATSKADARSMFTVTLPGSSTVSNGVLSFTQDKKIGKGKAILYARISSSKDNNRYFVTPVLTYTRTTTIGGQVAGYSVYAYVTRISLDTVRASVIVPNPYNITFTTASGDEVFNFEVTTIIPPLP